MFFFEGSKCPVCGQRFGADDDIVACPECGAPHHRECYKQQDGCAYEERHADGYIWQAAGASEPGEHPEPVRCGVCGAENPPGRLYCANCSSPLSSSTYRADLDERNTLPSADGGYYTFGGNIFPISDGERIDDVPVGDLKRWLGNMWYYYVPVFLRMKKSRSSVSFNFLAMFLHGIWFISQKMYVFGGVLLSLMLGVNVFRAYYSPTLMDLSNKVLAGDTMAFNDFVMQNPLLAGALCAATIIQYGVCIFCGLFGNKIYMKHSVRQIKRINREAKSVERFNELLESRGGSAMVLSLIVCAAYCAVKYYFNYTMMGM